MKKTNCLTFFSLLTLLLACSSLPSKNTGNDPQVIAKVNNKSITLGQLEERLTRPGAADNEVMGADEGSPLPLVKKSAILKNVIDEELVMQQAMKEGLLDHSERLRHEVMREYFQTKLAGGKEQPTEAEIQQRFEKEKGDLEKIRARHILIKSNKKKAEEILAKIRSQGEKTNFAALAKQYSEDETTKEKGGDLSYFTLDTMVPEFSVAVAKLKEGEVSDLVKTEFGYHIIQVTDDRRGLEANKGSLRIQLAKAKKKQFIDDLMKELHQKASLKMDGKVVAKWTADETTAPVKTAPAKDN